MKRHYVLSQASQDRSDHLLSLHSLPPVERRFWGDIFMNIPYSNSIKSIIRCQLDIFLNINMKSFFPLIERDTRGLKMGIQEIFPMYELTLDGL